MLNAHNYRRNREYEHMLPKGLLNAQGMGTLRQYRYGLFSFGWCGCEIIATYNFLQMLGKPQPLCEIAREIYRYGHILLGFFGTNVYVLSHYLHRHGIEHRQTCRKKEFLEQAANGKYGIVSFWTGKVMRSSIHTVAFRMEPDGSVTVFNRYNRALHDHTYADLNEAFGKYAFLTASWV